jgi:GDP-4-dehydro-6-deoxy-D-mannose reductase
MRCLITGATGFVGRHLARALMAAGHHVEGLARHPTDAIFPVHAADLTQGVGVEATLGTARPDWVFHLAAFANVGASFKDPSAAWTGNLTATQELYAAILRLGQKPRILHVSTCAVYGDLPPGVSAFTEDAPLRPTSPYAASKAAADLLAYQQTHNYGLDIVRVRPFNHIGPGQAADYAAASFARQIAAAERGGSTVIVGKDLSPYRDLSDVRDMVRAYIRLLEVGQKGEVYNAGSGQMYQIRDVLNRLIKLAHVSCTWKEEGDPDRTGDTKKTAADTRKLRAETGWTPNYSLDQSLADLLDDWRRRVA